MKTAIKLSLAFLFGLMLSACGSPSEQELAEKTYVKGSEITITQLGEVNDDWGYAGTTTTITIPKTEDMGLLYNEEISLKGRQYSKFVFSPDTTYYYVEMEITNGVSVTSVGGYVKST